MSKINLYLAKLTIKYIFINLTIITIFILFLNLIELSRILENNDKTLINFSILSCLKIPSILNEILPFVIIISIAFLFRNLINNNELISLRNIGYSIFDIFTPIGISVFFVGLFFLIFINPLSSNFENKFQKILDKKDKSLYSIKISNNEMWIKNKIDEDYYSFISISNIDLKDMIAKNIKILKINGDKYVLVKSKEGVFKENNFYLEDVYYYSVSDEELTKLDKIDLKINFNKKNILNSITNYKYVPFYDYISHSNTLKKFNLYSKEIGLFYLSETLKPLFIVMLSFVVIGFSGKFRRNENFFKVLFLAILVGFIIFFLREIINKITISLSLNFYISYLIIFILPFSIGLYQITKIEHD